MIESRQSYCKESCVVFWPTLYSFLQYKACVDIHRVLWRAGQTTTGLSKEGGRFSVSVSPYKFGIYT